MIKVSPSCANLHADACDGVLNNLCHWLLREIVTRIFCSLLKSSPISHHSSWSSRQPCICSPLSCLWVFQQLSVDVLGFDATNIMKLAARMIKAKTK